MKAIVPILLPCSLLTVVVYMCILQYMNTLTYLSREAFSSIPPELVPDLQRMLSTNEAFRPTAIDFTGLFINYCLNLAYIY